MSLTWDDRLYNWLYDRCHEQEDDRVKFSAGEIAEAMGTSRRTVHWAVKRLVDRKMVTVVKSPTGLGDLRNTLILHRPRPKTNG